LASLATENAYQVSVNMYLWDEMFVYIFIHNGLGNSDETFIVHCMEYLDLERDVTASS
jgi:hypothetical protein